MAVDAMQPTICLLARVSRFLLPASPFPFHSSANPLPSSGAPNNTPTIVSRLVTAAYWQRQCGLYFPPTNGYTYDANGHTVHDVNGRTGGWKLTDTTRLIWTNGQFDPWRTSGVSSEFRPGGPLASTPKAPVQIIPGGFHCSDLIARNGLVNDGVQTVIDNEIKQIVEWVKEYPKKY